MKKKYLPSTSEGKLLHLAEECNELAGIINKTYRFKEETCVALEEALDMYNPEDKKQTPNRELILLEIKDVIRCIEQVKEEL